MNSESLEMGWDDGACVLLTGARGDIGAGILGRLLGSPGISRILATSRGSASETAGCNERLDWFRMDISGQVKIPAGVDVVVNVAGEKRSVSKMRAANEVGAAALARAAAAAGVSRFVQISSVGVYGAPYCGGSIDESSPYLPRNVYERTKCAGEVSVRRIGLEEGMEVVVLQPSIVLSYVRGKRHPLLSLVKAVGCKGFVWFGRDDAWTNYISMEDVLAAVCAAVSGALNPGVYIVNSPARLSSLVGWIARELDVHVPRIRLPYWTGVAIANVLQFGARATGRRPAFDVEHLREMTNTTIYSPAKLVSAMGADSFGGIELFMRHLISDYRIDGLLS